MFLNLEKGSTVAIELGKQNCLVQCQNGKLWITIAGDSRDYFLEGNGDRLVSGPGKIVIEAIEGSCIRMHSEMELTVRVNEEYCCTELMAPKRDATQIKPRLFWNSRLTRQGIFRIETKITSA